MREIGKNIDESKMRVEKLIGTPLLLKVNSGRGKCSLYHGTIVNAFPAVFTVKLDTGESKTFPYADVQTHGIKFLKSDKENASTLTE